MTHDQEPIPWSENIQHCVWEQGVAWLCN